MKGIKGLIAAASVGVIVLGALALVAHQLRQANYNKGYAPTQPIAFSHKTHAGENQIPCMYCHFAAEKGRHAGIPPVEVCMNCHTQVKTDSSEVQKIAKALEKGETIKWVRVNHFPDFAYFNHSQHVRVGKLECQECHGPVESMKVLRQEKELNMGWCLECHRSKGIAPPEDHKSASGGDCSKCHY